MTSERKVDMRKKRDVFEKHQLKIAKQTLKYSDAGAFIMGGMTKQEAREVIARLAPNK